MTVNSDTFVRFNAVKFPILYDFPDENSDQYKGIFGVMYNEMSTAMKENHSFLLEEGITTGEKYQNGTWDGYIGRIVNNISDIGLFPIEPTPENFKVLDFSAPVTYQQWKIFSGRPVFYAAQPFKLFEIFNTEIWVCIFASILTLPLIIKLVFHYTPYSNEIKLASTLFDTVQCLFAQDFSPRVKSLAMDIVWFSWTLATFILVMCLGSGLLSALTIPDLAARPVQLKDILNFPDLKVYVLNHTEAYVEIKNFKQLYEGLNRKGLLQPITDANAYALMQEFELGQCIVVIVDLLALSILELFQLCTENIYHLPKEDILISSYIMPMRKGLTGHGATMFKKRMSWFAQSGVIRLKMDHSMYLPKKHCLETPVTNSEILMLKHYLLAFLAWGGGVLASVITLILELYLKF